MRTKDFLAKLMAVAFATSLAACAVQVTDGKTDSTGSASSGSNGGGANNDSTATSGGAERVRQTSSALSQEVAEPNPDPWHGTSQGEQAEPNPDPWNPGRPGTNNFR